MKTSNLPLQHYKDHQPASLIDLCLSDSDPPYQIIRRNTQPKDKDESDSESDREFADIFEN